MKYAALVLLLTIPMIGQAHDGACYDRTSSIPWHLNSTHDFTFSQYKKIRKRMSQGEVLSIAGQPHIHVVDSHYIDGPIKKSWYYFGRDKYVTRIQFHQGDVEKITRSRALLR